jgi:hypothetical protein
LILECLPYTVFLGYVFSPKEANRKEKYYNKEEEERKNKLIEEKYQDKTPIWKKSFSNIMSFLGKNYLNDPNDDLKNENHDEITIDENSSDDVDDDIIIDTSDLNFNSNIDQNNNSNNNFSNLIKIE